MESTGQISTQTPQNTHLAKLISNFDTFVVPSSETLESIEIAFDGQIVSQSPHPVQTCKSFLRNPRPAEKAPARSLEDTKSGYSSVDSLYLGSEENRYGAKIRKLLKNAVILSPRFIHYPNIATQRILPIVAIQASGSKRFNPKSIESRTRKAGSDF